MPKYEVTAPDGRMLEIEGERPPTEGELRRIFGTVGSVQNKLTTPQSVLKEQTEQMSPTNRFFTGVGGGMRMVARGIEQKLGQAANAVGLLPDDIIQKIKEAGQEDRANLNTLKSVGSAGTIGEVVGEAAPGMVVPGGVKGGLARRMGTGALAGGATGALRFSDPDKGETTFGNAGTGAAIGGAVPLALVPIVKGINAVTGKLTKPINAGAADSIPTTLGEDIGSPFLQKMETLMERIPIIGTSGFRKKQYEAASERANEYLGNYVADGVSGTRGMLEENRKVVSSIYDKIKSQFPAMGATKNAALETADAARELSKMIPEGWDKFVDPKIISTIKGFEKGGKVPSDTIHSFEDLWNLRKGIGDLLGQAKNKMFSGDVNATQYGALSKLYSAINKDMDRFAETAGRPDLSNALRIANDAYKNNIVKYNILDRAMDKAAGQEGTGKLFSPQRFSSELNKILTKEKYNNLFSSTEKQQMAGMANIMTTVKRAGQYMENPPTGNRAIDAMLTGGGLYGAVANPVATAKGAAAIGGAVGTARFLTTTTAGKRLAMAAATLEPDSPAIKALADNAQKMARTWMIEQEGQ